MLRLIVRMPTPDRRLCAETDTCPLGILLIGKLYSNATRYLVVLMLKGHMKLHQRGFFVFMVMWTGSEGNSKVTEMLRNRHLLPHPRAKRSGKMQC